MGKASITTRDELIVAIHALIDDYKSNGKDWENTDVDAFLEAMAAWLNDATGYYKNIGSDLDVGKPSWQLFADALWAAAAYE